MATSSSCDAGLSVGLMAGKEDAGPASTIHQNNTHVAVIDNNNPPSKTDKPRPHVCSTCQRCFARLEHLKRHERSHTKEKPFECPECTRCFARRDLLLRHQQKLHVTTTPSARPRNRRESTATTSAPAGTGPGRVRKNSLASGHGAVSGRPRANTISHIEGANIQLMSAANAAATTRPGMSHAHNRHASLAGLSIPHEFHQLRRMSSEFGQGVGNSGLPKLETHDYTGLDYGNGLRTAPLMGGFNYNFDNDGFLVGPNATINPSALHYSEAPSPVLFDIASSYQQQIMPSDNPSSQQLDESLDWMNGFDHQLSFQDLNERGIDGSSPSAISSASQSGISEIMLDGSNNPGSTSVAMWSQSSMANPQMMMSNQFSLDLNNIGFHDVINHGPLSPHSTVQKNGSESFFSTPPQLPSPLSPSIMSGITSCHGWNALQGTRHRRSAD